VLIILKTWSRIPSFENLRVVELIKELPSFYGTTNFVTMIATSGRGLYSEPYNSNPYVLINDVLFLKLIL
jgi:hypothetical protein